MCLKGLVVNVVTKIATETDRIKSSHESTGGGFPPKVIHTRPMAGFKQLNLLNESCKPLLAAVQLLLHQDSADAGQDSGKREVTANTYV